jgi:putative transcriptional regulator
MVKPTKVTNSIRSLRFEHGEMTQADLAKRIGVTRQTVIAIERGRYSPSLEMAFQIAQVFNAPLDHVFQYPVPSSNQGNEPMESSSDRKQSWPATGRFVDELRKLRSRPDTERLVNEIDKLRDRPDTERLVDEIRKLGEHRD